MNNDWKVIVRDRLGMFGKEVIVYRKYSEGRTEMVQPDGTTQILDFGTPYTLPTLLLPGDAFSALVDAIHADYKPSEGKFTEGKLEGTERHLSDLRQLLKLK